ncbi:MAG: YidC/Oxa1 family insertase periplasmic-domain containing protein [Lentisphaeria bacterium]|nr:YidC/Oxa1 family insertase periplasmic-domain containing protein [Lentisphaeria bacterium]
MKYDKVTILGVAGCVLAFILLMYFAPRPQLPPPASNSDQQTTVMPDMTPPAGAAATAATDGTTPADPADPAGAAAVAAPVVATPAGVPGAPRLWPDAAGVPLPLIRPGESVASIDSLGGGMTRVVLENYFQDKPRRGDAEPSPVVLGNHDAPFLALDASAAGLSFNGAQAENADGDVQLSRTSLDGRLTLTETWSVDPDNSYQYRYTLRIRNLTDSAITLDGLLLEGGALPPSISPDRKAGRGESAGGAAVSVQGEKHARMLGMKDLVKMSPVDRQQLLQTPVAWTAVHSKYFLFHIWQSSGLFAGVDAATAPSVHQEGVPTEQHGRYRLRLRLPAVELPPAGDQEWTFNAYAGPKNFKRLHALGNGVDTIMEMDRFFFFRPAWMGFLSRMLLEGMVWISGLFPPSIGYGMGVICLTLLVKLLFWPLTHKSTVSMRKMQALQPQLKELREKYKDDAQKMYRKQQELFKENKVSQLGGCLPMLLQIPVFFALFNTFRNAVELRHAGFLWAADLSLPDTLAFSPDFLPIRPFAILMGATMYWQQKMTPSADPNQAKMMNMMSLFFIVLFYGMPSALTLYMAVNYLLTIGQTVITRKMEKTSPVPAVAK